MDPVQIVISSIGGVVCGLMAAVIVLLILSLMIGKTKVRSLEDATSNLADNTMAFSRTVSKLGDRVVRLGSAAGPGAEALGSAVAGAAAGVEETWDTASADQTWEESEDVEDEDSEDDDDEDSSEEKLIMTSGTAQLIEDEDGDRLWRWRFNLEIPIEDWVDEFGPLTVDQLEEFAIHSRKVDLLRSESPEDVPALVQELGYDDLGHWNLVYHTFLKHHSAGEPGGNMDDLGWSDKFNDAMVQGAIRAQREEMAGNIEGAQDSELLEPVEGVSCEVYASIAAQQAQGLDQDGFLKLLADHDMDQAKFDRVATEWQSRMSRDLSFVISTIYSTAFAGAGAGQFGAAGQAAAAAVGEAGVSGAGAEGEAPVSLEKYSEIMGAMDAWSSQGKDVNAMLKEVFDMTALDWSNCGAFWSSRLATDWKEMGAAMEKAEEYAKQYGKVDGADDDVEF